MEKTHRQCTGLKELANRKMSPFLPASIWANMLKKNDLSAADWTTLRDTPYLVGFSTVLAGSSGLATIKELIALSQGIIENQASNVALIRDLTTRDEMEAAQASLKQSFGEGRPSSDGVRQRTLEHVRSSINLMENSGSEEEASSYRRMLYGIAEKVANAAREGGFLGFGGTQVSEGERSFLNELRSVLQLEPAKLA
jgi:hypothetical protein